MATRQDSSSNSAHQNQRPTPHNEDAIPEMTEEPSEPRGRGENDDELADLDEIEDEEEQEGSF